MKDALQDSNNKEIAEQAKETLEDVFIHLTEKQRRAFRKKLEIFVTLDNRYDYLFVPKNIIKAIHEKRKKIEQQLSYCCKEMTNSIKEEKCIEYEMITREYFWILSRKTVRNIRFCPWCGADLETGLVKKYFDTLKKEYGIDVPDLTNFTNVPEEFQSDAWWKKRGL